MIRISCILKCNINRSKNEIQRNTMSTLPHGVWYMTGWVRNNSNSPQSQFAEHLATASISDIKPKWRDLDMLRLTVFITRPSFWCAWMDNTQKLQPSLPLWPGRLGKWGCSQSGCCSLSHKHTNNNQKPKQLLASPSLTTDALTENREVKTHHACHPFSLKIASRLVKFRWI